VNPGDTGELIGSVNISNDTSDDISYSEPLCCTYLFSQDELTILQNNTDLLTQINLSFHRWAEYSKLVLLYRYPIVLTETYTDVSDGSASAFDYAYNVALYNNNNGDILYSSWQSTDLGRSEINTDTGSVL
jgi:hypothetical protein